MRVVWNAPVTLGVAGVCSCVYLLTLLIPAASSFFVLQVPGWSDITVANSVTLISNIFGHASWGHLAGNLMLFLLVAPACEERFGSRFFFFMILVTALIISAVQISLSGMGLMGLSGIVFMTMLAGSATNIKAGQIPLTLVLVAALFWGRELMSSLMPDNVSQLAHLVGGICGAGFGLASQPGKA